MTLVLGDRDRQPGVLLLTLNRPEQRNALSKPLLEELDHALAEAASDSEVRCVVITGAGARAFSAGADIREQTGFTPDDAYAHMRWGQDLFDRIAGLPKPTIAAINGFALGGGLELALACDFRTASVTAEVALPEVTLASLPGWGGTQRLARLVGPATAKLITMTGQRLGAARCLELGLVQEVFPADEHLAASLALAAELADQPAASLEAIKHLIDGGIGASWADALEAEAQAVRRLWGTPAQKQAQQMFFARRKPASNPPSPIGSPDAPKGEAR
jgi:enoyl-CoA hydratase/carnithine racemase